MFSNLFLSFNALTVTAVVDILSSNPLFKIFKTFSNHNVEDIVVYCESKCLILSISVTAICTLMRMSLYYRENIIENIKQKKDGFDVF